MRWILVLILLAVTFPVLAQVCLPVKINHRWGLINGAGALIVEPVYEAIGEFKRYGFAVMQRQGRVGLLNQEGQEVVPPRYEDLRVVDSLRVAVMDHGQWMVVDFEGRVLLNKGYDRLQQWEGGYLAFRQNEKWGVINARGDLVAPPKYDEVALRRGGFILTQEHQLRGVVASDGLEVLPPVADQLDWVGDSLIFFRRNASWGVVTARGQVVVAPRYQAYERLSAHFYRLENQGKSYLFSLRCRDVVTQGEYSEYLPLTAQYIITRQNHQLGLLNDCGQVLLSAHYDEILQFSPGIFRVCRGGRWGLARAGDTLLTDFRYHYIAPLRGLASIVKRGNTYGLLHASGQELVAPQYERILLTADQARAYRASGSSAGDQLDLLRFDAAGFLRDGTQLEQHFRIRVAPKQRAQPPEAEESLILDQFEWFYDAQKGRWGLRDISTGAVKITPLFQWIKIDRVLGVTLVAMPAPHDYEFERTTFRFEYLLGLVGNEVGALITDLKYWDIKLEDFRQNLPLARFWGSDGRFGLLDRRGRVVRQGLAFLGPFHQGLARMSTAGRLSAAIDEPKNLGYLRDFIQSLPAGGRMVDFTQYDQMFRANAQLTCEDCQWGYLDTTGREKIADAYTFAEDFVNGVAIVQQNGKWGVLNLAGRPLIPFQYDAIHFLENTQNRILRMYVQRPKYGLIDTLGQLAVHAVYDELGQFREGRLGVVRNNLWGFVDAEGTEVIPCRFREVGAFYEGLAGVKLGRHWGFVDKQGAVAIDFRYRRVGNFSQGLAWVETEHGVGFINHAGKMVIAEAYDQVSDFDQGLARVRQRGKYGLINLRGQHVLRPRYRSISAFDRHGLAIAILASKKPRAVLINRQGRPVGHHVFAQIQPFAEGLAVVKGRSGYGYIDTTGRIVIPLRYTRASSFAEGRAAVYQQNNCGYISRIGEQVAGFTFTRCQDFSSGRAVVFQGNRKAGLLDVSGQMVLEPSINRILEFKEGLGLVRDEKYRFYFITEQAGIYDTYYQQANPFNHGVAVVQVGGKWGIINRRGMEVVAPKYSQIQAFENGYAKVKVEGVSGLSTLEGQLIAGPDFEYIRYAGAGFFRVEKGDKMGYFDSAGNWIWGLSN